MRHLYTRGEPCDTLDVWMNSPCQLLPIGFYAVVYGFGKGRLSPSTTLLTQCFRKKPEEFFMALDFSFLGKQAVHPLHLMGTLPVFPRKDMTYRGTSTSLFLPLPAPLVVPLCTLATMYPHPCSAATPTEVTSSSC